MVTTLVVPNTNNKSMHYVDSFTPKNLIPPDEIPHYRNYSDREANDSFNKMSDETDEAQKNTPKKQLAKFPLIVKILLATGVVVVGALNIKKLPKLVKKIFSSH